MPASQDMYTTSMPVSPPPPTDISTYARSMHDHTKRLMEMSNMPASMQAQGRTSSGSSSDSGAAYHR